MILFSKAKTQAITKDTIRKTRSMTRAKKSQRLEVLIKQEGEDMKATDTGSNQHELIVAPLPEPIVKTEDNYVNLKGHIPELASEEDIPLRHTHSKYYCKVCQKHFFGRANYRQHLKCMHQRELACLRPMPNLNISPNPHDSSNHCDSCNRTYKAKRIYRNHIRIVHKMVVRDFQRATPNPNTLPDIDDLNYHCKSCQANYKNLGNYRGHLRHVHKMKLSPLKKRTAIDPNISDADTKNPNNASCAICKFTYSSTTQYRKHMEKFHKDGKNTPLKRSVRMSNRNINPDPNDPNLFCNPCQMRYARRDSFRRHIRLLHPNVLPDVVEKPVVTNPLILEIDAGYSKNKRCTICDKEYLTRWTYTTHINTVHKDGGREPIVDRRYKDKHPNVIPVWNDSNNYCRSCKKKLSSRCTYHDHIKRIHKDVLQ